MSYNCKNVQRHKYRLTFDDVGDDTLLQQIKSMCLWLHCC